MRIDLDALGRAGRRALNPHRTVPAAPPPAPRHPIHLASPHGPNNWQAPQLTPFPHLYPSS